MHVSVSRVNSLCELNLTGKCSLTSIKGDKNSRILKAELIKPLPDSVPCISTIY